MLLVSSSIRIIRSSLHRTRQTPAPPPHVPAPTTASAFVPNRCTARGDARRVEPTPLGDEPRVVQPGRALLHPDILHAKLLDAHANNVGSPIMVEERRRDLDEARPVPALGRARGVHKHVVALHRATNQDAVARLEQVQRDGLSDAAPGRHVKDRQRRARALLERLHDFRALRQPHLVRAGRHQRAHGPVERAVDGVRARVFHLQRRPAQRAGAPVGRQLRRLQQAHAAVDVVAVGAHGLAEEGQADGTGGGLLLRRVRLLF